MYTSFGVIYQNTNVVTTLVGLQKDIAHITVSYTGTKINNAGVSAALLNGLSNALECYLTLFFYAKLNAHSLDSYMGQNIPEWTKQNLRKSTFKKCYLVHSWIP